MDAYHVFVGSETGYLKGVSLNDSKFINVYTPASGRGKEVVCMCWGDENEQEVCIGTTNQEIKVFDSTGFYVSHDLSGENNGELIGLGSLNKNLLTCTNGGLVRLWSDDFSESQINHEVGSDVCFMRQNMESSNLIATGGKENDLSIWDLNSSFSKLFSAKNVRHDWLNLRVPVWVLDAAFLPGSDKIITSTSHYQVRLYDPKCQRRPVLDMKFGESPITSISIPSNEMQVVVGNSHGNLALMDLRGKSGKLVHKFKGPTGAIKSVRCIPSSNLFACCGLDRFMRIYDITTKSLVQKVFLKAKLNCLLLRKNSGEGVSTFSATNIDTEKRNKKENDDAEVWSQMNVIGDIEEENIPKKSQKSKNNMAIKNKTEKKSRKRKRSE